MTKHYCDKCGVELPLDFLDNVKIGAYQHCIPDKCDVYGKKYSEYDTFNVFRFELCQNCASDLIKAINGTGIETLID